MKRNPSIELLRCLLMYGICLVHCVHRDGTCPYWIENLLLTCVCGFVFISGWFGINFTPSKALKLYGVQFACVVTSQVVDSLFAHRAFSLSQIGVGMRAYWFGHAYVLMMLFAPCINRALDDRRCAKAILPVLIAIFGWAFSARCPILNHYVPRPDGLSMYSAFTLLGIYVAARLARRLEWDQRLKQKVLLMAVFPLAAVCGGLHLGFYNSPFAVAFSGLLFLLFLKVKCPLGRFALWLGPSMFSVYFLHMGSVTLGTGFMMKMADAMMPYCLDVRFFSLAIAAFITFVGCIALDLPRRLLVKILDSPLRAVCTWIDDKYVRLVDRTDRYLDRPLAAKKG